MCPYGAGRDVQPLTDLAVGKALGGQLSDLELLCRQLIASGGIAAPARLARCAQFPASLVAPRRAAKRVERVAGGAQRRARLGNPTPASQPLAVRELETGALERPAAKVGAEGFLETLGGVRFVGK